MTADASYFSLVDPAVTNPFAIHVPHDHAEYIAGCFCCDLSRAESAE